MIRIIAGRNTGKTYKLLEEASKTNGTIICSNPRAMAEKARAYGFKGIDFIAYTDFFLYKSNCNINNYYIDELENFIQILSSVTKVYGTFSGYTLSEE